MFKKTKDINSFDWDKIRGGEMHQIGEPEYIGSSTIKQELEILPDEGKPLKLNWVVKEYIGCEAYFKSNEYLYKIDDIKVGDEIFCFDLKMIITSINNDKAFAENERHISILNFAEDDRKCWVCSGLVNKRGIKNTSKSTIIG